MEHTSFDRLDEQDAAALKRVLVLIAAQSEAKAPVILLGSSAKAATSLLEERLRRREVFSGLDHLFGEPAWDMLLLLAAKDARSSRVSITELGIGSSVPGTTVLRYLEALERAGVIVREPDWQDRRRTFILLSDRGTGLMERYLHSIDRLK